MTKFSQRLLKSVKLTLRETSSDFDEEIMSYIESCANDLQDAGISSSFFYLSDTEAVDSQILQAVRLYCLSKYGLYNTDAEKYDLAYRSLKATLCSQSRYTRGVGGMPGPNGHGMFYSSESSNESGKYSLSLVSFPKDFTLREGDFVILSDGFIVYVTEVEGESYHADTILSVVPELVTDHEQRIEDVENGIKIIKEDVEALERMKMLPTPILRLLDKNTWQVHSISPDASTIEFWDGSSMFRREETNGAPSKYFNTPRDGKIRNIAVRVTAAGYHPSAFSNTVVYPNLNDVMTEFVKTRRNLSRVYFPFYGTFPYNDINNRVKMEAVGSLGVHRSLPITDDSQNVIVPAINSAEKCLLLNGNDAGKQNRRLTFTRCKFINNDSVTASNALPDEMVIDPFPRKECTIEMWINSQTTRKGCLFASVSREDNGGTPNFYDFYWDTFNGQRAIILNMQTEKPQTDGVSEGIQILQIGGVSQDDKGWFHLVFTQEVVGGQTVTKLYVNGTLRERWTVIPLFHDCQTARAIYSVGAPCGDSGNAFDGAIHSFGIYDFVWTEGQVKAVYEAEKE